MPLAHVPSLARGQVTPLVSQRGQGDARPARYGQKRCRCMRSTTAGNQSASWRAGPAGHPAPSAALRCALGPALSASGTGAPGAQPALQGGPGNRMAPGREGAGLAGRSRSAASSLSTASAVDRPVNMDGITLCGIGVTGTHATPPIWTGGDSSAIASQGAQIGLFRAPASPGSAE